MSDVLKENPLGSSPEDDSATKHTSLHDWRGTPIEVGSKVITHGLGKFPVRALGYVTRANNGSVTVDRTQSDSTWRGKGKIVIGCNSVTVLTKDMLDE